MRRLLTVLAGAVARCRRHLLEALLQFSQVVSDRSFERFAVLRPGVAHGALRRADLFLGLVIAHRLRRFRETIGGVLVLATRIERELVHARFQIAQLVRHLTFALGQ